MMAPVKVKLCSIIAVRSYMYTNIDMLCQMLFLTQCNMTLLICFIPLSC